MRQIGGSAMLQNPQVVHGMHDVTRMRAVAARPIISRSRFSKAPPRFSLFS